MHMLYFESIEIMLPEIFYQRGEETQFREKHVQRFQLAVVAPRWNFIVRGIAIARS